MKIFKLFPSNPFFFLFLLFCNRQFFVSYLPEFREFFLFCLFNILLLILSVDLLLSWPFNSILHLCFSAFLFFKETSRFLLCFSHLLVKDFILSILNRFKHLSLMINQFLSSVLFFLELLLFSVFSLLVHDFLLHGVYLNFSLFFFSLLSFFQLSLDQLLVWCLELIGYGFLFKSPLMFSLSFSFQFIIDLSLNEFSFEHLILHSLNHLHLKLMQLVVNNLLVCHFLLVLFK